MKASEIDISELRDKIKELDNYRKVANYFNSYPALISQLCVENNIETTLSKKKRIIKEFCMSSDLENLLQKYSSNYIAQNICPVKTYAGQIIFWAKKRGIKTHSVADSCYLDNVKKSKRDTLIRKYGVDNVSKSEEIKQIKRDKALERYGVENVFMAEEIKEKTKKTMLERYGAEHISGTDRFALCKNMSRRSKFQEWVENVLSKHKIKHKYEVRNLARSYNSILDREYSPIVDIYIPEYRHVIECYGDVWHANPLLYKRGDTIVLYKGETDVEDIWEFDKVRENQIKNAGYSLTIIWEYDMNHNKQKCEQYILDEISKNKNNK